MKKIYFCLMMLILHTAFARAEGQDNSKNMVEYLEAKDFSKSYSERRGDYGGLFEIKIENLVPDTYVSPVDGMSYSELWSSNSIQVTQIGFSEKTNFNFGSITIDAGYGFGSVNSAESGSERTLKITYPYLGAGLYLDQLSSDAIVVPYGKIKYRLETIEENSSSQNFSKELGNGLGYSLGLLINVGMLDQVSSGSAYVNYGIENTYLDIFVAQYLKSENTDQIEIQNSSLTYGAGLVWEF